MALILRGQTRRDPHPRGYRRGDRRARASQARRPQLRRPLPFPQREDAVVLGQFGARIFSLFRLRCGRHRVQLRDAHGGTELSRGDRIARAPLRRDAARARRRGGAGRGRARRRTAREPDRRRFFRPRVVEDARWHRGARRTWRRAAWRPRPRARSDLDSRPSGRPIWRAPWRSADCWRRRCVWAWSSRTPRARATCFADGLCSRFATVRDGCSRLAAACSTSGCRNTSTRPNRRSTQSRVMSTACTRRALRSPAPIARSWSKVTSTRSRFGRRASRRRLRASAPR